MFGVVLDYPYDESNIGDLPPDRLLKPLEPYFIPDRYYDFEFGIFCCCKSCGQKLDFKSVADILTHLVEVDDISPFDLPFKYRGSYGGSSEFTRLNF